VTARAGPAAQTKAAAKTGQKIGQKIGERIGQPLRRRRRGEPDREMQEGNFTTRAAPLTRVPALVRAV
jgi:hypothetical protein